MGMLPGRPVASDRLRMIRRRSDRARGVRMLAVRMCDVATPDWLVHRRDQVEPTQQRKQEYETEHDDVASAETLVQHADRTAGRSHSIRTVPVANASSQVTHSGAVRMPHLVADAHINDCVGTRYTPAHGRQPARHPHTRRGRCFPRHRQGLGAHHDEESGIPRGPGLPPIGRESRPRSRLFDVW